VQRIERAQIAQQSVAGRSTADILGQLVPALSPASGTTSNYGMTMRGRNVQVMIDGVPLTGSRDGARQLNSITPAMIERIEVVSGASNLYGAGATGGLVNIITRHAGDETASFSSELGLRSADHPATDNLAWQIAQTASFQNTHVGGFLGLSYSAQGERRDAHGQRIGPEIAQSDRQDTSTLDLNGRLDWRWGEGQRLHLGLRHYDDRQDSDYGPDYGPNLAALLVPGFDPSRRAISGLRLDDQPRTRHDAVNIQYQHADLSGGQHLSLQAYWREETARWFPTVAMATHPLLPPGFPVVLQSQTDIEVQGLRSALQKDFNLSGRILQLNYGLDHERERDRQSAQTYDINDFIASNGLDYRKSARHAMGPDVRVRKTGVFVQADAALGARWNVQAGVRRERIGHRVAESTPLSEAIVTSLAPAYPAQRLAGGKVGHSQTLFNLGAVLRYRDWQQVFARFSQGFSLPDTQRMLRDVGADFIINSDQIDPIQVNNYELGWRTHAASGFRAGISAFYNTSDKVVQFNRDFSVSIADTDERVWGVEGHLHLPLASGFAVGGTLAQTRGHYRDAAGQWQELDAFRVSPAKATLYVEGNVQSGYGVRLQSLSIAGSRRAFRDAQSAATSPNIRATPAANIHGYSVLDLIVHAPWLGGKVSFGIYNIGNREYKSVYSQQAEATYGALSSLPAQGQSFAVSYVVEY